MSSVEAHRLEPVEAADWLTRLLPIFGALGVGSLLNTWLTGGSARRKSRADVLKSLAVCERARWYPMEAGEPHFVVAARDLEADAMIAGVPAAAVETYIVLGRAAAWLSAESMDRDPDPEFGGGIHSDYANVTRDARGWCVMQSDTPGEPACGYAIGPGRSRRAPSPSTRFAPTSSGASDRACRAGHGRCTGRGGGGQVAGRCRLMFLH